jgi:hypothetical protein
VGEDGLTEFGRGLNSEHSIANTFYRERYIQNTFFSYLGEQGLEPLLCSEDRQRPHSALSRTRSMRTHCIPGRARAREARERPHSEPARSSSATTAPPPCV